MITFVLIGHCGPDAYLLKNAIVRAVPGASIVFADDEAALTANLNQESVLLVNRLVEGGDFDTGSGVELIRRFRALKSPPVSMLVSNFAEAQSEAQAAGAMQGFGKKDVNSAHTAELLRAAAKSASHSSTEPD